MQNRIDIIMKYEFLKFTAGRFEKKEVDNAKSVAFSRAGWKIPAIINLRGRVEGYVRNPPLENSSWPASLKSHPSPTYPPGEITRAEPAASITLNIAENESPLPWKERWPHSEKLLRRKFYKTQTHLILYSPRNQKLYFNSIEWSDPRISDYSSNPFFPIYHATFENISKLRNEGSNFSIHPSNFVILLIHQIPNFLAPSFHRNFLFFLPSQPLNFVRCTLQHL